MRSSLVPAWAPRALWLAFATFLLGAGGGCGSGSDGAIVTASSTGFTPKSGDGSGTTLGPSATEPSGGPPTVPGGSSTSLGKPTLKPTSTISTAGLDAVHFGMTVTEAEKAAGSRFIVDGPKEPSCYRVKPEQGPEGVLFLVADEKIVRVDISRPPIATRSGAKVGSSADQVRQLYTGQVQDQARPDGQPGSAIVFVPRDQADANFRLVFLTDGSTVQGYRAGRLPQVTATTGCGR